MIKVYHNPLFQEDTFKNGISCYEACTHVADVNTESLEEAFRLTNTVETTWTKHKGVNAYIPRENARSTSVGDLLIRDGEKWKVEFIGFSKLEI